MRGANESLAKGKYSINHLILSSPFALQDKNFNIIDQN